MIILFVTLRSHTSTFAQPLQKLQHLKLQNSLTREQNKSTNILIAAHFSAFLYPPPHSWEGNRLHLSSACFYTASASKKLHLRGTACEIAWSLFFYFSSKQATTDAQSPVCAVTHRTPNPPQAYTEWLFTHINTHEWQPHFARLTCAGAFALPSACAQHTCTALSSWALLPRSLLARPLLCCFCSQRCCSSTVYSRSALSLYYLHNQLFYNTIDVANLFSLPLSALHTYTHPTQQHTQHRQWLQS